MAFQLDEHCILRDPELHDGYVDGIHLTPNKGVTISLRDVDGQTFSMQLIELVDLVCNDFRETNIIYDIRLTSGQLPDASTLAALLSAPHPSAAPVFHDHHAQRLQQYSEKVTERALVLVSLNPSYGCELIALCREVLVSSP
jgi:hypothetical protein